MLAEKTVARNFKLVLLVLFILILFFTTLAFLAQVYGLDTENYWKANYLVIGFLGGLVIGKSA